VNNDDNEAILSAFQRFLKAADGDDGFDIDNHVSIPSHTPSPSASLGKGWTPTPADSERDGHGHGHGGCGSLYNTSPCFSGVPWSWVNCLFSGRVFEGEKRDLFIAPEDNNDLLQALFAFSFCVMF